jgi:hypothetical protein
VGFYVGVGCVLVGETSHPPFSPASSSMLRWPSVLSSVDFWPVTSPLRRPTAVPCLIHWMIVGVSFVQGKEEVGFLPADVLSGWCRSLFSVCGQRGGRGGFPSSRCDFWVGVSCFSVRGPAPSFPWECFVVVATLGSSSVDFCQAISPPRRPNSVACTHRGVSVRRWTWFFQGQIGGGFPFGGCAYG